MKYRGVLGLQNKINGLYKGLHVLYNFGNESIPPTFVTAEPR